MKIKAIVTDPALHEFGLPTRGTPGSAGLDLRAMMTAAAITLVPGGQTVVSSGLRVWVEDPAYAAIVLPRSGKGSAGLVLGNTVGLIDADYQGDLKLTLWNRTNSPITIQRGERVAQLVVVPVVQADLELVESFEEATDRAEGGFGSTGAN